MYKRYRSIALYGIFGILTTIVNVGVYWLVVHLGGLRVMPGSVIAWATAVLFAYLTNRILVFQSGVSSFKGILKEMLSSFN